eukprot:3833286-Alexandrium_andersonii.AAC.1
MVSPPAAPSPGRPLSPAARSPSRGSVSPGAAAADLAAHSPPPAQPDVSPRDRLARVQMADIRSSMIVHQEALKAALRSEGNAPRL